MGLWRSNRLPGLFHDDVTPVAHVTPAAQDENSARVLRIVQQYREEYKRIDEQLQNDPPAGTPAKPSILEAVHRDLAKLSFLATESTECCPVGVPTHGRDNPFRAPVLRPNNFPWHQAFAGKSPANKVPGLILGKRCPLGQLLFSTNHHGGEDGILSTGTNRSFFSHSQDFTPRHGVTERRNLRASVPSWETYHLSPFGVDAHDRQGRDRSP